MPFVRVSQKQSWAIFKGMQSKYKSLLFNLAEAIFDIYRHPFTRQPADTPGNLTRPRQIFHVVNTSPNARHLTTTSSRASGAGILRVSGRALLTDEVPAIRG